MLNNIKKEDVRPGEIFFLNSVPWVVIEVNRKSWGYPNGNCGFRNEVTVTKKFGDYTYQEIERGHMLGNISRYDAHFYRRLAERSNNKKTVVYTMDEFLQKATYTPKWRPKDIEELKILLEL